MISNLKRTALSLCVLAMLAGIAGAQAKLPGSAPSKASASNTGSPVDINSASKEQLTALPGIGQAYAQKIVDGRPFKTKRDLVNRHIVPESVYSRIQNQIVAHRASGPAAGSATPK